ncbi:bifunctional folylpolyglutamate synthase/dihydrofolate synthase [Texcoconibacillus texcoconensis]|uniref:tetrahydrofolate synthase n=1 Tax=Texcoconibacillus texcoconensis TaxID=1095777 RepID=A0A840QSW6_9BACI|nr:folylpolyglutamate synthase/dihydrofolate synthase family protein [Texcoconibacillus texcoconensis]MBB5174403.1 dihydrofolate synthase/folylpolyglutamate synthase [Texcoconibacillus texcoconensis]
MTVQTVEAFLREKQTIGMDFEGDRLTKILAKLDHPERKVRVIHVTGTNGKGSTVAMFTSILQEAGFKVGAFTSPALESEREQISINGEWITEEDFFTCVKKVQSAVEEVEANDQTTVTSFEWLTLIALYYFSVYSPVDIAIIETGLGGEKDATNVVYPLLSVITNVAFDHTHILGDSVAQIAKEKAGIIKNGVPVFTAATGEALPVIEREAKAKHAPVYQALTSANVQMISHDLSGLRMSYHSTYSKRDELFIPLKGEYQLENVATVLMSLDYLKMFLAFLIDDEDVERGLRSVTIPGRFEQVSEQPNIILDTAHNVSAISHTLKTVRSVYPEQEIHILFASMADKNNKGMLKKAEHASASLTVTSFASERAAPVSDLLNQIEHAAKVGSIAESQEAVVEWTKKVPENAVGVVTGSHAFIASVRRFLTHS